MNKNCDEMILVQWLIEGVALNNWNNQEWINLETYKDYTHNRQQQNELLRDSVRQ